MAILRCMLFIGSTLLFCNRVFAVYTTYFEYGDKNNDGVITDKEAEGNKNMAWLSEWRDLKEKMHSVIKEKLAKGEGVTRMEFAEMSLPHGKRLLG